MQPRPYREILTLPGLPKKQSKREGRCDMNTVYASDLARAEAESRTADSAVADARVRLIHASNQRDASLKAVEAWTERASPALAAAPGRPYFSDPKGGNEAVTVDGEPVYADKHKRLRLGADVIVTPPLSEDRVVELETAVADAEDAASKAQATLHKARAEHVPAKATTGYEVVRAKRINGTRYARGDPIDVSDLDWRKAKQLADLGIIRLVGR